MENTSCYQALTKRYGSAAHLHHFLKCRQDELSKEIQNQINHHGEFRWILRESVDKEWESLGFLSELPFVSEETKEKIQKQFNGYGINNPGKWQHWDAIFTIDDTLYIIEAKARLKESQVDRENGGASKNAIKAFFNDQFPNLNVESWLGRYYQLANRLSMAAMLNQCGVKTKVVYLFFENGFKQIVGNKLVDKSATRNDFENELLQEIEGLGIAKEQVQNLLAPRVFINVEP